MVPTTPPRTDNVLPTPRQAHATRFHADELEEDREAKRARIESQKKQKINQIRALHEAMTSEVEFGDESYYTMDSYEVEKVQEELEHEDEVWRNEDALQLDGIPEALWSDESLDAVPADPERWVDELAEKVAVSRLLDMEVLQKMEEEYDGAVEGKLTTKFVFDWRKKTFTPSPEVSGESRQRWMRRARYVAREFATTKRLDTYSPATSSSASIRRQHE